VSFEEYLVSKKIDRDAFSKAEPVLFETWKAEFEQMHPNSFTVQKLNLINPIRRKYQLKLAPVTPTSGHDTAPSAIKPGKPVIKPKPKIN
jgi:hypothetical protein